ncbi:MAG: GntR family transcriptional regulator, partial [Pseudomonadota bacterium]
MGLPARSIGERRATLAGEARGEIERMIVEGDLAVGEKLNELALSNAMGVSRGTVREAIRSLADSGLIDLIANRGAFVHETTLTEVRNLYDLRGAIFAMACASSARRVAEGAEPKLVRQLDKN